MIRRLRLYQFFFRFGCFLLPALSFLIAGIGLRSLKLIHPLSQDYIYLSVTLSLAWIVCAEHFEVSGVEALFLESNGMRNCLKALAWTYMLGFTGLFFYRGASYSRLLLSTSALILLAGVLLLRVIFRNFVIRAGNQGERLRIIIVGADAFAQRTSEELKRSVVAPCETVAFVRVPGQQVNAAPGVPVFELEQLMNQNIKHFANDIVIAVSPEILPFISKLIEQLRGLAIPIRLILDFGENLKVRERFFRIGGTQFARRAYCAFRDDQLRHPETKLRHSVLTAGAYAYRHSHGGDRDCGETVVARSRFFRAGARGY